ncbi:hypothetical protein ADU16_24235 [Salmonella enterica subsp. enterica serovar Give]|nr:hypothetical protein [Salmonella enterica subsp. enterica serovar Give]
MSGIWICSAYVIFSLFRSDPISGGTGSSKTVRPLTAPLSQYAAHYPLLMTIYIVLTPFSVMRLAGAENSDMIISSPWYTSGKFIIQRKSDHTEKLIR